MAIRLGSNKGNPRKPLAFKQNSDIIKILCYIYGQNSIPTCKQNSNTTITHGKEILINHVMLCKIGTQKIQLPRILSKKKEDIHDFLWNYKVRVNRNTITLPIEMVGLVIIDSETQCEVMNCSILTKFIKEKSQDKTWVDLMLQLSDQQQKSETRSQHL